MQAEALGLLTRKAEGGYWQPLVPQLHKSPSAGSAPKVGERLDPSL